MTIRKERKQEKKKKTGTNISSTWLMDHFMKDILKTKFISLPPRFLEKEDKDRRAMMSLQIQLFQQMSCFEFQEEKVITMTGVDICRMFAWKLFQNFQNWVFSLFSKLILFLNIFFPPTIEIKNLRQFWWILRTKKFI